MLANRLQMGRNATGSRTISPPNCPMHNSSLRVVATLLLFCSFASCCEEAHAAEVTVREFLTEHCVRCHGSKKQEADLRLDSLADPTVENELAADWSRVLEMIEAGEMPPQDEPRPDADDVNQVLPQLSE
ncbi:MAG: hypothetical protein ACI9G1_002362, partial [Pirellulaceae bacterium]